MQLVPTSTVIEPQEFVLLSVQEEIHKLQAEVSELDCKLSAVTQALTEATTAREDERYVNCSTVASGKFLKPHT